MEDLKKISAFLICIVWIFASIGSPAYLFYYELPHLAIASMLVSAMAFPFVKERAREVLN